MNEILNQRKIVDVLTLLANACMLARFNHISTILNCVAGLTLQGNKEEITNIAIHCGEIARNEILKARETEY